MAKTNFIRKIIEEDLETGKHDTVVTRFPPEPNGYLHIGHAKSIVLNHGIARDYEGRFHLRFDDTNPLTEETEYVESIKRDVAWLGADWGEHLYFASDYFEKMYELAERLIQKGEAYVDSLSPEEIREYRGNWNEPGKESPYRDRSVEENLELFRGMRDGEYEEGEHVLRAKIDMAADNMVMRDPVLYRIVHADHHRQGDAWCIYPMYDYAHCLEDSFEDVTHSLCTLEFENNRELYNWVIEHTEVEHQPRQIEFARLNLNFTVMSKRRLRRMVEEEYVDGWDDPRMPTISAFRRRGVRPQAIRDFINEVGVARKDNIVEYAQLEAAIRDDLNTEAPRVMCVEEPLKVTLTNYPEGESEWIEAPLYPHDVPKEGTRMVPFGRELYIDRDDFREDPPEGFYRLYEGNEVRLRYGYIIKCEEVVRDEESGEVVELKCSYDPQTRGGEAPEGRQVDGTIHWVSAAHALPCELRLYDRLFEVEDPMGEAGEEQEFLDFLNDESLVIKEGRIEPSVRMDAPGTRYQFERNGYFVTEFEDSSPEALVYNRIVTLRDTWAGRLAEERKQQAEERAERKRREKERKREEAEQARRNRIETLKQVAAGEMVAGHVQTPRDEARAGSETLRERLELYLEDLGLTADQADLLSGDEVLSEYYEELREGVGSEEGDANEVAAAWLINALLPRVESDVGADTFSEQFRAVAPPAEDAVALVEMLEEGRITNKVGGDVLEQMIEIGEGPETIVEEEGLEKITDTDALGGIVEEVISENAEQVEQYAAGKQQLFGFFIGQVMRATQGQADPQAVRSVLQDALPEPSDES